MHLTINFLSIKVLHPFSLQSQVYKFRLEDLPSDPSSAESAAAVLAVQRYCGVWPLINDTYSLAPQWLKRRYGVGKVAVVSAKVSPYLCEWLSLTAGQFILSLRACKTGVRTCPSD